MSSAESRERDKVVRAGDRNPLAKVMRVIDAMLDAPGTEVGIRDLARTCGLPPSTVHRLLGMLEEPGLVRQDESGKRYRLGLEFFRLAWRGISGFPIRQIALPVLRELVDICDETAAFSLYDPVRMENMLVARVETQHLIRSVATVGTWSPVYAGSGLAVMAFLSEAERQEIIVRTRLRRLTDSTITIPLQLERELERIRQQGYACTRGQRTPGLVGIAAPIWGPSGQALGELALGVPEQRFDPGMEPRFARLVIAHAQRITEKLGGRTAAEQRAGLDQEGRAALATR